MKTSRYSSFRPGYGLTTPLAVGLFLTLGLIIALVSNNVSIRNAVINMFIYVVLVLGLYVFSGTSGVMSFGHAAFMAVGAYVASLLTMSPRLKTKLSGLPDFIKNEQYGPLFAITVAALVAAFVGLVAGSVLMRLNGMAAGIATLALLVIAYVVLGQWTAVTAGPGSLVGVPVHTNGWLAWVFTLIALVIVFMFQRSSSGIKLKASREDLLAARASGVRVYKLRLYAFTLSAFIVGIGGALFAMRVNVLSPGAVYIDVTFMMLAMLVVGGTRSLTGAVLGVALIGVVGESIRWFEGGVQIGGLVLPGISGLSQVGVALLLLLSLIFRPNGLLGSREAGDLLHNRQNMQKKDGV